MGWWTRGAGNGRAAAAGLQVVTHQAVVARAHHHHVSSALQQRIVGRRGIGREPQVDRSTLLRARPCSAVAAPLACGAAVAALVVCRALHSRLPMAGGHHDARAVWARPLSAIPAKAKSPSGPGPLMAGAAAPHCCACSAQSYQARQTAIGPPCRSPPAGTNSEGPHTSPSPALSTASDRTTQWNSSGEGPASHRATGASADSNPKRLSLPGAWVGLEATLQRPWRARARQAPAPRALGRPSWVCDEYAD